MMDATPALPPTTAQKAKERGILHRWKTTHLPAVEAKKAIVATAAERVILQRVGLMNRKPRKPLTKLRDIDVRNIKRLLRRNIPQRHIAKYYDVVPETINKISTGKTWAHVQFAPTYEYQNEPGSGATPSVVRKVPRAVAK